MGMTDPQTDARPPALDPGNAGAARPLARLSGGVNQAGGRAYNERLALSLIRLNGPLPKAELARLTGLSAQTMSLIIRRLEADGLVVAQEPVRGRIGQPSVPYALNPHGALSFGVKIGRRSTEVVLCDFHGAILDRAKQVYAFPVPDKVLALVKTTVDALRMRHEHGSRIAGIGVAMPFELWKWAEEMDAPGSVLERWRDIDIAAELEYLTGLPVAVANDASAACGAELAYCHRGRNIDLLYLFIGSFIGGGIALNGALVQGRTGNAGALGSLPIPTRRGASAQLINFASLITLEKAITATGDDPAILQTPDADWNAIGAPLDQWLEEAARAIAFAVVSSISVFDFGLVTIDGALPRAVLLRLVDTVRSLASGYDLQGLSPFDLAAGSLGSDARPLGGAMLPINDQYGCGQDILLKSLDPA